MKAYSWDREDERSARGFDRGEGRPRILPMEQLLKRLGPWTETELVGNSVAAWLLACGSVVLLSGALRVLQAFLVVRLDKTSVQTASKVDDVLVSVLRQTKFGFHLSIALLVSRHFLELPERAHALLVAGIVIFVGLQCGLWAQRAFAEIIGAWAADASGRRDETLAAGLVFLSRFVVWTLVLLVVLSNLGVELSAVIAGLGVGGVAAALAVQSVLGDLIAGVSMYFDRPFGIGDAISLGEFNGRVVKIGSRTTRLAGVGGEEIIVPNSDLVKSKVRNFARLRERRVQFAFGIEYNLPLVKVEKAREITMVAIASREGLRLDRVHFKGFGTSSLDFEIVYFVLSADFGAYMDHQQAINLEIYRRFEEEGIPFAFPSQTVYLRSEQA